MRLEVLLFIAVPLALVRRRSRCPICGRPIVPEDDCPYCESGDVTEHRGGSSGVL